VRPFLVERTSERLLEYAVSRACSKILVFKDGEFKIFYTGRTNYFDGETRKTEKRDLLLLRVVVLLDFVDDIAEIVRAGDGLDGKDSYNHGGQPTKRDVPACHRNAPSFQVRHTGRFCDSHGIRSKVPARMRNSQFFEKSCNTSAC
jgi:hypothetical protein